MLPAFLGLAVDASQARPAVILSAERLVSLGQLPSIHFLAAPGPQVRY